MFVSSSAAQFLVNGLELVGLAEGDELHDLVRQPHLRGGSGFYGIARIPITADKNFFICHLAYTEVDLALLRKNHGRAGKAVGADGRDNDALGLRIKDRPACRQRISGGTSGGRNDQSIRPVLRDLAARAKKKHITLIFSHVNEQPMSVMVKDGFTEYVGAQNFHANIVEALDYAENLVK